MDMEKNQSKDYSKLAEQNHQPRDYGSNSFLETGYAQTHEQVTDSYTEGTIDALIEGLDGSNVEISREGYNE